MKMQNFFLYLGVMAGVTYLIRTLPYVLMKREVNNRYIKSFLTYIPYTVLAAMTFPAIIFATDSFLSAVAGCIVATILAYFKQSLVKVAMGACGAVLLAELIIYVFK